jgi:hypothetical protein
VVLYDHLLVVGGPDNYVPVKDNQVANLKELMATKELLTEQQKTSSNK